MYSDIYRSKNLLKNFDEFLVNLFMPLYEVSINPESHPKLHKFLQQVRINMIKYACQVQCNAQMRPKFVLGVP